MTTRKWLIVVASFALGMGIVVWAKETRRRVADRRHRAHEHFIRSGVLIPGRDVELRSTPETEYHAKMARKWLEAAKRPWRPVEPDPPPPQEQE
jgi:hypothetical protein